MPEVEISWLLVQLRVLAKMVSLRGIQDVDIPQLHEARIFFILVSTPLFGPDHSHSGGSISLEGMTGPALLGPQSSVLVQGEAYP